MQATPQTARFPPRLRARRTDVLRLAAEYGVRDVRVFGSVARGDARPGSDIDLLARLDPEVTLLRQAALVRHLETLLGCRVDLVSERALRPRVRDRVLREAVPL